MKPIKRMTRNFKKSEFDCRCGCTMPDDVYENVKKVAAQLQVVRDYVGVPVRINSAYRCINHNRSIGSKDTSQHVLGKAVDITIDTFNADQTYKIIINLLNNPVLQGVNFNGIGRYNTFVHLDIRYNEARWDLRS